MKETRFIDTSVLLEILEVPNRCDDPKKYQTEFAKFCQQPNATLIMPISVLVETGNHVNQISDKVSKNVTLKRFADILDMFLESRTPWSFYGYDFKVEDISRIVEKYKNYVYSGVGIGDVFILDAYEQYVETLKSGHSQNHLISIWSLDSDLSGYSQTI